MKEIEVNPNQYWQLVNLLNLVQDYKRKLGNINKAIAVILEVDKDSDDNVFIESLLSHPQPMDALAPFVRIKQDV